jgi:hypothetical protein
MRAEFCSEYIKRREHLGNIGVDGRIILKRISDKQYESVNRVHLAQDGDKKRALVNTIMKLRVS